MGTQKMFPFNKHQDLVKGGSLNEVLMRRMALFVSTCWSLISSSMFYLITFITRYLFRFQIENISQDGESKGNQITPSVTMNSSRNIDPVPDIIKLENSDYDGFSEKETPTFTFKFQFQRYEDILRSIEKSEVHVGEGNSSITDEFQSSQHILRSIEKPEAHVDQGNSSATDEFQIYEDGLQSIERSKVHVGEEIPSTTDVRKYSFMSDKEFTGFIEEPKILTISSRESDISTQTNTFSNEETVNSEFGDEFMLGKGFRQFETKIEAIHEEVHEDTNLDPKTSAEKSKQSAAVMFSEKTEKSEEVISSEDIEGDISDEIKFSEKDLFHFDSDEDSIDSSDGYSIKNHILDSSSDAFLSEEEFREPEKSETQKNQKENELVMNFGGEKEELVEEIELPEDSHLENSGESEIEAIDFGDGSSVMFQMNDFNPYISDADSIDFSDDDVPSVINHINYLDLSDAFSSDDDFQKPKSESEDTKTEDTTPPDDAQKSNAHLSSAGSTTFTNSEAINREETESAHDSEEAHQQNVSNSDCDEGDGLESLWEHQDLIEQLKMELKKARSIGLPTILEESESPKIIDDLKPWKIEEQEDPLDELQKFYKRYRERMRKFDILNYQKMYAIGFLQLKDPLQSKSSRKPAIASLLSQNLWLRKRRKSDSDPSAKFVKELESDLEMVYVGQACLSWEFLHWQYRKVLELPETDPHRSRQYNQVAGEFQQFQVLVQRFLENEPFQGPRVQNYVKNRCVLRNLLQVPAIREDCFKDKVEGRRRGNDAITSEMLARNLEELMRIFWEFIKADKDESGLILKGLCSTQPELQDPADLELFVDLQSTLQKKEKRLKDLVRTGNCIVRRFQKHQNHDRSGAALFFSQVDMKLVSRVLKMSRLTTDQLVWCHKKLNKISFTDRKLHREPSFLLFPC